MAIVGTWTNALVTINGVDMSDHIRQVTIETTRAENDITAFGAQFVVNSPGLGDATITMEAFQDFAAGELDATLWPLSTTTTPFTVAVRADTGAISATNPEYQMSSLMYGYSPIDGEVGSPLTTPLTFRNAAQTGLVRDITP
jgi:hypothetical protein